MDNLKPKHTGLAGTFLFGRRPESPPQEPAEIPDVPDAQPSEPVASRLAPRVIRRRKKPQVLRDKCTIFLERSVNDQLNLVAGIENRERSEVVTELLREHLPKYIVEREP